MQRKYPLRCKKYKKWSGRENEDVRDREREKKNLKREERKCIPVDKITGIFHVFLKNMCNSSFLVTYCHDLCIDKKAKELAFNVRNVNFI